MGNELSFGALAPGQGEARTFELAAGLAKTVTPEVQAPFSVTGMTAWRSVEEVVDPSELPGGPGGRGKPRIVRTWEVASKWDRSSPSFSVPAKQMLTIDIQLTATNPGNPAGYHATLLLHIAGQNDVPVALDGDSRGEVRTTILTSAITGTQGGRADLSIQMESVSGGDTSVQYTLWPDVPGVTLLTTQAIQLSAGESKPQTLSFKIDAAVSLGDYVLNIVESAFADEQRDSLDPSVKLTVTPATMTVTVSSATHLSTRPGVPAAFNVHIDLGNASDQTTVVLAPLKLPPGVGFLWQVLNVKGSGTFLVSLAVPANLVEVNNQPAIDNQPITLQWTAYGGAQKGTLDLTITVAIDRVHVDQTMKAANVTLMSTIVLQSDGHWGFVGTIDDSSVVTGDKFTVAFAINFRDGNTAHAFSYSSWVGGGITGGDTHTNFNMGGEEDWIANNWDKVKGGGVTTSLSVSEDPAQVFEAIFAQLPGTILALLGVGQNCHVHQFGNNPNEPPPSPGSSGTGQVGVTC